MCGNSAVLCMAYFPWPVKTTMLLKLLCCVLVLVAIAAIVVGALLPKILKENADKYMKLQTPLIAVGSVLLPLFLVAAIFIN